jgi:hypothetical protein
MVMTGFCRLNNPRLWAKLALIYTSGKSAVNPYLFNKRKPVRSKMAISRLDQLLFERGLRLFLAEGSWLAMPASTLMPRWEVFRAQEYLSHAIQ